MGGTATAPGHLAGRDDEQQIIVQVLDRIATPRPEGGKFLELSPWPPIKIVGPRGVGKTTLLHAARHMAAEGGVHFVFAGRLENLTPKSNFYMDLLAGLEEKKLQRDIKGLLKRVSSVSVGPVGVSLDAGDQVQLLRQVLQACLEKQPLALLVDEAMECDPEVLGRLLVMCQEMMVCKYPLALVLAGTPKLDQTLAKARASFIDRTENIYIGALVPEATREALQKPFVDRGAQVQDAALKLMEGMTDNYPFFIQVVGFEVWNAMAAAGREKVDRKTVKEAEAKIQAGRNDFYETVYDKMLSAKLVDQALHVMEVLRLNGGKAAKRTIIASLAERFADNASFEAVDVFHELVDHGFIWSKGRQMEAGIPSFFSYCQAAEQEATGQERPAAD